MFTISRTRRPLHRFLDIVAGWSSPVARQAHNLKVVGSNPTPATKKALENIDVFKGFSILHTGYALAMGIPWESREIQILAVVGVD